MIRINITAIIQNEWVLDGGLEHPKELRKLRNDYPLAPDKIEIKWEILSDYQLKNADFYNISIGNITKIST